MSESKKSTRNADALAKQLKESLSKRRFQPWKVVLASLVLCSLLLAGMGWWMYPRVRAAPLQIVALDAVCTPDETPAARAQLLAPPEEKDPRLSGQTVVFHEPPLLLQADAKPREVVVTSDARGQASAEWSAQAPLAGFLVNYIDANKRNLQTDRGQIFVWAKDSRLLVVDAEETLVADEVDAKASAALKLAAKDWRIVYLALAGDSAHDFRKARGWIIRHQAQLPLGPVLGKSEWPSDLAAARRAALDSLKSRFTGAIVTVVKSVESARISQDAGLQAVRLSEGLAWDDVPARLK